MSSWKPRPYDDAKGTTHVPLGMLTFFAETPLHISASSQGESLAPKLRRLPELSRSLPLSAVAQARTPSLPVGTILGALRVRARLLQRKLGAQDERVPLLTTLLGLEDEDRHGVVVSGPGTLLAIPARTTAGMCAWVSSQGLCREVVEFAKLHGATELPSMPEILEHSVLVSPEASCMTQGHVGLEEFTFVAQQDVAAGAISSWLVTNLFPVEPALNWWREKMRRDLVIVRDEDFAALLPSLLEVRGRQPKSELEGGRSGTYGHRPQNEMFELFPQDSFLWARVGAEPSRAPASSFYSDPKKIAEVLKELCAEVLQLGGQRGVGKGLCRARVVA